MADADEIPVSEAEQAFLDAMKAVQDVQDTQPAITDAPAFTTATDDNIETNGAAHHGSNSREGSTAREEEGEQGDAQDTKLEEDTSSTAGVSVAPSVTPSIAPQPAGTQSDEPRPGPTTGRHEFRLYRPEIADMLMRGELADMLDDNDAGVSSATVSVPIPKDEATESAPTTPVNMQQQPSWGTPQPQGQSAPAQQKSQVGGKRKRLPQDTVGRLEDRIAEDPRGDVPAWLALIAEHKRKGKFDDARAVYERFFQVFPQAVSYLHLAVLDLLADCWDASPSDSQAEQWVNYVRMELENNEFQRVEQVFSRCLLTVPNVELWSLYLDYIRRRNNLTNDPQGKARTIISQAYDFVLTNIGCDKEAGRIWQDQIAFVKSGPGNVGGSNWMDQQKMDSLRRVYQKAVTQPVIGVEAMWREYDAFEHGLNKITVPSHVNRCCIK
jgi:cleavage stimulation factor subunit 3